MLEAFKDIAPDISAVGTHSLRSGGATAAANAGVPNRLNSFMAAGLVNRLRTSMSKILYLHVFEGFRCFLVRNAF